MRRVVLLIVVAVVAGCGGGGKSKGLGYEPTVLYSSPDWQVVVTLHGSRPVAEVLHRLNNKAVVDKSGAVKIEILGPKPNELSAANPPQVAITMHSKTPLVESALWVDGNRLLEKGGGTPTNGTIYGAPVQLLSGTHTAVGYARTAFGGTAVAWAFRVP